MHLSSLWLMGEKLFRFYFSHTGFRGAQFKACNFQGCTFKEAELVAANLKNSNFKEAKFENTLFDSAKLEGADFEGAEFKKVIFVATDISKAKNLEATDKEITIFNEMPEHGYFPYFIM